MIAAAALAIAALGSLVALVALVALAALSIRHAAARRVHALGRYLLAGAPGAARADDAARD